MHVSLDQSREPAQSFLLYERMMARPFYCELPLDRNLPEIFESSPMRIAAMCLLLV